MPPSMKSIKAPYQTVQRHLEAVVAGAFIALFGAVAVDAQLSLQRGAFSDPLTGKSYEFFLDDRGDSRHFYVWPEGRHCILAAKIRDFDADGRIDHVGGFTYPRMPFEVNYLKTSTPAYRKMNQRFYDLALSETRKPHAHKNRQANKGF